MAHTDDVCQYHSGIETDISIMKDSIKQIELKMDRPPVWMTFVLTGMGAVIGFGVSWVIHLHTTISTMSKLIAGG
jgi:hypothetical protein